MGNPANQLDNLVERIEESDAISDADRETLLAFNDRMALLAAEYSDHRRLKLLRHVTLVAENVGGVADALTDRDAAEELVRWIHDTHDNPETNRDYRVALRVMGRRVTDGDDPPDALDWIPTKTPSSYDPSPEPSDMLDWETDVQAMLDATMNARDAAAIALQFDAGLRGGEFADLTVGDISDHRHGLQVSVDGKQGRRTVTLIPSVPHVQQWFADHPASADGDAPLWSKLDRADGMSYTMITKMFQEPARRAEITKPVTLTNFRKSSAYFLASRGVNQAQIEDHHGWVRGSRVAGRYIALVGEGLDSALADAHGLDVADAERPDETAPVDCPRCGGATPRERSLCVWCGQALKPGAADMADQLDDLIAESLADADGDDAERLLEFRDAARRNPSLRADAIDELAGLLDAGH